MVRSPPRKMLYRMVARIHEQIDLTNCPVPPPLPEHEWANLLRTVQRMAVADSRGWLAARRALSRDFALDAEAVIRRLESCRQELEPAGSPRRVASISDVYDDLIDLQNEFGNLEINLREGQLSVATDDIELDGVPLGRFEIALSVNEIGRSQPYAIVALDGGNPAGSNSDVIHPHVQDGSLCEGEGRAPIRAALREGRLFDFFVLVRQVLQTYNPGSAYVSLRQWNGRECHDCGDRVSVDDATSCDFCDRELCDDCSSGCRECGRTVCSVCRNQCAGCDEDVCDGCIVACRSCADLFCPVCLTEGQCGECSRPEEPIDEATTPTESANENLAHASLHPVCVGQAVVPP